MGAAIGTPRWSGTSVASGLNETAPPCRHIAQASGRRRGSDGAVTQGLERGRGRLSVLLSVTRGLERFPIVFAWEESPAFSGQLAGGSGSVPAA